LDEYNLYDSAYTILHYLDNNIQTLSAASLKVNVVLNLTFLNLLVALMFLLQTHSTCEIKKNFHQKDESVSVFLA
jgi:hypothetical protein